MKWSKGLYTSILGLAVMLHGGVSPVAAAPPPPGRSCNLIKNGTFSAGTQYWHVEKAVSMPAGYAHLNGQGTKSNAFLSQTVTIPAGVSPAAVLKFDLRITTADSLVRPFDNLYFWIFDWNAMRTTEMHHYSNLDAPTYSLFTPVTIPMAPYIGHTISIFFEGLEDYSLATSFDLDNVKLVVTVPSGIPDPSNPFPIPCP